MIDYQIYKILHISGIVLLMLGLSAVLFLHAIKAQIPGKLKMIAYASHGIGTFLILLGGFGMLARLGLAQSMPTWVHAKLAIWVVLALAVAVAKRKAQWTGIQIIFYTLLAATATYVAVYKPF